MTDKIGTCIKCHSTKERNRQGYCEDCNAERVMDFLTYRARGRMKPYGDDFFLATGEKVKDFEKRTAPQRSFLNMR